jgi:DNA-binding response OmpR family regulator|tara:strand:- start:574 stop:828 length:255 start_codon:yes stop_codon:yes gene_type:complete
MTLRLKRLSADLVLADLVLPSASGMDFLEASHMDPAIKRPRRVVLMTGITNPVKEMRMTDIGIAKILAKPFTLNDPECVLADND